VQHGAQPLSALRGCGQLKGHARSLDARLGPANALRHRRLRDQKGVGDFGRGQAAHRPQGEGDRRGRRQGGMAAHEEQRQGVVLVRLRLYGRFRRQVRGRGCRFGFAAPPRLFAVPIIGHAPRAHLNQPAARVIGQAVPRPLHRGRQQSLLHGVFAGRKSWNRRTTAPSTCGARSRSSCSQEASRGSRLTVVWARRS